jgi:hypothetical protein
MGTYFFLYKIINFFKCILSANLHKLRDLFKRYFIQIAEPKSIIDTSCERTRYNSKLDGQILKGICGD